MTVWEGFYMEITKKKLVLGTGKCKKNSGKFGKWSLWRLTRLPWMHNNGARYVQVSLALLVDIAVKHRNSGSSTLRHKMEKNELGKIIIKLNKGTKESVGRVFISFGRILMLDCLSHDMETNVYGDITRQVTSDAYGLDYNANAIIVYYNNRPLKERNYCYLCNLSQAILFFSIYQPRLLFVLYLDKRKRWLLIITKMPHKITIKHTVCLINYIWKIWQQKFKQTSLWQS